MPMSCPTSFRVVLIAFLSSCLRLVHAQVKTSTFVSNPDINVTSLVVVQPPSGPYEDGFYLTCPRGSDVAHNGAAMYTSTGDLVWSGPAAGLGDCFNFRTQNLNGVEVLTLWTGTVSTAGWGQGRALILDYSYNVLYNLTTSFSTAVDIHEFAIPSVTNSTALVTVYEPVPANLKALGGSGQDWILESRFQELDIVTGEVLFTWNASAHVPFSDSYSKPWNGTSQNNSWDFFHINSVDKAPDGSYLVSSRQYRQVYKIDGITGEVVWTLGGKKSSWSMCFQCGFEWQHNAQWRDNYTAISLFDNASDGVENDEASARGMIMDLHPENMTVTLRNQYLPLRQMTSSSQGNVDLLSNGNVLVGWGANPWLSEHSANGTLIYSAALGSQNLTGGQIQNYRAYKSTTWRGYPLSWPDISIVGSKVYASWNGATKVLHWEVLAGSDPRLLSLAASQSRTGFETVLQLAYSPPYAQVKAIGANGTILGISTVLSNNGSILGGGGVTSPPSPPPFGQGSPTPVATSRSMSRHSVLGLSLLYMVAVISTLFLA
ncbi:hypothetical protein JAAARDRAFT_41909 [Jaapia argillacea MUCL 33604]|uniref:ASST-domain-containing protein n=1 Tax=Jaapia argillacea MUCL 33604 TaxID=933084 RepID=A0A067P6R5_9AGAM|nr:hypothetical protein JAAARDRAFT_41909 [Jaapia argillacea MUCL 33604]